jgi:tape measure domain-containing protein
MLGSGAGTTKGVTIKVRADTYNAEKNMAQLTRSVKNIDNQVSRLGKSVKIAAIAFAGFVAVNGFLKGVAKTTDSMVNLENRLALVVGRGKELNQTFEVLRKISAKTGSSVKSSADIYSRFGIALKSANVESEDLYKITETLQKSVSLSGADAVGAEAALMQLGQAMSSGVFRGEEFNSVNEQLGRVMESLSIQLGKTRGELRAMAEAGELTSDVVFAALLADAENVNKEFETLNFTTAKLAQVFRDELTLAISKVDKAFGISESIKKKLGSMTKAVQFFNDNFEGIVLRIKLSVNAIKQLFAGMSSSVQNYLRKTFGGDRWDAAFSGLGKALAKIQSFIASVIGFFKDAWHQIVGNSYWPEIFYEGARAIAGPNTIAAINKVIGWVYNFVTNIKQSFSKLNNSATGLWEETIKKIESLDLKTSLDQISIPQAFKEWISSQTDTAIAAVALGLGLVFRFGIRRAFLGAVALALAPEILNSGIFQSTLFTLGKGIGTAINELFTGDGEFGERLIQGIKDSLASLGRGVWEGLFPGAVIEDFQATVVGTLTGGALGALLFAGLGRAIFGLLAAFARSIIVMLGTYLLAAAIANPIGAIITVIIAGSFAMEAFDLDRIIGDFVGNIFATMVSWLGLGSGGQLLVKNAISGMIVIALSPFKFVGKIIKAIFSSEYSIADAFRDSGQEIVEAVNEIIDLITAPFEVFFTWIGTKFSEIGKSIRDAFSGLGGISDSGPKKPSVDLLPVEERFLNETRPKLKAAGGFISGPGTATSDSIPAMLSNGEYVVKGAAVDKYGINFLDKVNQGMLPKFATGGYVGGESERLQGKLASLEAKRNRIIISNKLNKIDDPGYIVESTSSIEDSIRSVGERINQLSTDQVNNSDEQETGSVQSMTSSRSVSDKVKELTGKGSLPSSLTGTIEKVMAALDELGIDSSLALKGPEAIKEGLKLLELQKQLNALSVSDVNAVKAKTEEIRKQQELIDKTLQGKEGNSMKEGFSSSLSSGISDFLKGGSLKDLFTGLLDNITSNIIDNFSQGLTDSIMDSKLFKGIFDNFLNPDNFKKLGKSVGGIFKEVGSDPKTFEPMKGGLTKMFSGVGNFFKSIFGSIFGGLGKGAGVKKLASGGVVPNIPGSQVGKDSVPAMLMPGERVLSKSDISSGTRGAGSNRTTTASFNINVTGDVSSQTRREIMEMIPQIARGVNADNHESNFSYR